MQLAHLLTVIFYDASYVLAVQVLHPRQSVANAAHHECIANLFTLLTLAAVVLYRSVLPRRKGFPSKSKRLPAQHIAYWWFESTARILMLEKYSQLCCIDRICSLLASACCMPLIHSRHALQTQCFSCCTSRWPSCLRSSSRRTLRH